jgi:hypothetical protein
MKGDGACSSPRRSPARPRRRLRPASNSSRDIYQRWPSRCSSTLKRMNETDRQRGYREDARLLGEIGAVLARTELPPVTVRLPSPLARAALEAWQHDDEGEPDPESYEQRVLRHRAGALGLIGLSIEQRGRAEGDEVVVELSPDLIGNALDAADDLPS